MIKREGTVHALRARQTRAYGGGTCYERSIRQLELSVAVLVIAFSFLSSLLKASEHLMERTVFLL